MAKAQKTISTEGPVRVLGLWRQCWMWNTESRKDL